MAERKAAEEVREQAPAAEPDARANSGGVNILFVGDVVGGIGKRTLLDSLPILRERYAPTFVVVNAENSAGGLGVTPKIADELLAAGVDAITLGNHTYHRREIYAYLESEPRIVRPANYPKGSPGRGWTVVENGSGRLGVANLSGMLFMGVVQSLMALMTISPNLNDQFSALVNLAVVTNVIPYLIALSALPAMMRMAGVRETKYRRTVAVALIAMVYSVFVIYTSGKDAVFGGMLVAGLGWVIWGFIATRFYRGAPVAVAAA